MKILLKVLLVFGLVVLALKLLLPYQEYPIAHFEYKLAAFLPILSWKIIAILSRISIGLLFVVAFYILFKNTKVKWLAMLMLVIPFIIEPLYPESFKDSSIEIDETLPYNFSSEEEGEILVAYLSYNCLHCKEAAFRLSAAMKKNQSFPKVKIVSYNSKIEEFLTQNDLDFSVDTISPQLFVDITEASFPKFALVKNGKVKVKFEPEDFNFAVLDNLSK